MSFLTTLFKMTTLWQIVMLYYFTFSTVISAAITRLQVTAPMKPVNINSILSIHCQIWNQKHGDRVQMYRTLNASDTHSELLSVAEDVLPAIEERVYLAVRNVQDGSRVYFLSVTDVTRDDQGDYECKLFRRDNKIAEARVTMKVNYFPDENPVCSSVTPLKVKADTLIRLNCSSSVGSPLVRIRWTRSRDSRQKLEYTQRTGAGVTYAELKTTLENEDSSEVFVCEVSSPALPGVVKTCIVGPITVTYNKNDNNHVDTMTTTNHKPGIIRRPSTQCNDICSWFSAPVFQWVIASIIAGVTAIFFCIVGVVLYVKYNRMYRLRKEGDLSDNMSVKPEGIYDEVDVKPYMTLHRQPIDAMDKDMQFVGYYRITPNMPKPILPGQI